MAKLLKLRSELGLVRFTALPLALSGSLLCALSVFGCADSDDAGTEKPIGPVVPKATHSGLISIHEASMPNHPMVGRGLSVRLDFTTAARAPDYDDGADQEDGCRAWLYDMDTDPPPAISGDEGKVNISGTTEPVPEGCVFSPAGYVCPAARLSLESASLMPNQDGTALLQLPNAAVSADLAAGRYLQLEGVGSAVRFPVLAVPSENTLLVHAPGISASTHSAGQAILLAGAGPVPNNPRDSIQGGERVTVSLEPSDSGHFQFDPVTLSAGGDFTPDTRTLELLAHFPIEPGERVLSCSGPGGDCGDAEASAVSIVTTDADVSGLSPFAFPVARRKQVSVLCAARGGDGSIVVPAAVTRLFEKAQGEAPITRIRVAYMRSGFVQNAATEPANPVTILIGHQKLGFVTPR